MSDANNFEQRRSHLAHLNDQELKQRFWQLTEQIVNPLMELGQRNTTPSIERSILMRMGFSSLEARAIVEGVIDCGLMGKGAGHIVYWVAKDQELSIRDAGLALIEGRFWNETATRFSGGES